MEENQTPRFVDSFEELGINEEPQQVEEPQFDASTAPEEPTPQERPVQEQPPVEDYSFTATSESSLNTENEDLEREVLGYLSERLGREFSSFDDLNSQSYQVDESVESIARFVQETGRRPEDWFTYQSLDPEGMDDMTAIMVDMSAKYQNLSQDEIRTLVQNKYKLDEDRFDEEDIKLSKLQLKIDAQEAKRSIDEIRQNYKSNFKQQEQGDESPFDDQWLETMQNETMALEAVEFDLGQGQTFKFGLDQSYTRSLVDQNANLETFFDQYISDDGDWNFDRFNADRAVLGNINKIMSAVYRKGLGDGQRGLLNTSANIQSQSPQRSDQPTSDPVASQIRQAMGMGNSMTFKL